MCKMYKTAIEKSAVLLVDTQIFQYNPITTGPRFTGTDRANVVKEKSYDRHPVVQLSPLPLLHVS